jgi:uncharacterized protein (TIGR02678 family)
VSLAETLATSRARHLTLIRRRLVASPLLHKADEPELWPLVLRYRDELARWFVGNLGWRLVVDLAGEFVRLHKIAAQPDPSRPAELNGTPLTARRYTLLLLACAALDEQPRQTTLSILSQSVAELTAGDEAIRTFDPSNSHTDRLAFAGALRWLATCRIISVRDGNLDAYVNDPTADALLDINDRLLSQLLSCPTSPALVDHPAQILDEVYPAGSSGSSIRAGHQVLRRLVDDPLVYFDELTDQEREWIGPRWQVVNRIAGELDLAIERRSEGFAAVDSSPDEPVSDIRFPAAGSTVAHCALLVAEYLTNLHRDALAGVSADPGEHAAPIPVPRSALVAHVQILIGEFGARCDWARWVFEAGGSVRLTDESVDYLARFGLVRRLDHAVVSTPAIARFGVGPPTRQEQHA